MIVIACYHHDLATRERSPKLLEERTCSRERISPWAMAQLEYVAEQDELVDLLERVDQCRSRTSTAQHVST